MKKVGKATRPFRYNLHQIPYTVEVTNRFKGLDLIDRLPEELWMEAGIKIIPKKKKCKKAKRLPDEALQISEKKKKKQRQRRKGKINPSEYRVLKNKRETRKPS